MEQVKSQYRDDLCLRCGEISCTLNFDEALEAILEAAHLCLGIDASSVFLLNPSQTHFSIAAVRSLSGDYVDKINMPIDDAPNRRLLQGEVVSLADLSKLPSYREMARAEGLRAALAAPLKARGRIIGARWGFTKAQRIFSAEERSYLATLSAQGGVTLGNVRLHRFHQEQDL